MAVVYHRPHIKFIAAVIAVIAAVIVIAAVLLRYLAVPLLLKVSDSVEPLIEGEDAYADDEDEEDGQQDGLHPADLHQEVAKGQDDVEVGITDDGGIGGNIGYNDHLLIWLKASFRSERTNGND